MVADPYKKFLEKYMGEGVAFKMIKGELDKAHSLANEGKIAPVMNLQQMRQLPHMEFLKQYESQFYGTFQHELAEAVNKIMDLAESFGFDLRNYLEAEKMYHEHKKENPSYH